MKRNVPLLIIVMLLLALSSTILVGSMLCIVRDDEAAKPYVTDTVSDLVVQQGEAITDDSPTAQTELNKKFSDMAEVSKSGKSITVISEEFLDSYWGNENNIGSRALTSEEVLYIVQDSIRLYFEYEEYVMVSNHALATMHQKLNDRYAQRLSATYTVLPIVKEGMAVNYRWVCSAIHQLIIYRLAALSTPDAFIYGDETGAETEGIAVAYWGTSNKCILYIPKDYKEASNKQCINLAMGAKSEAGSHYFNLYPDGQERIELCTGKSVKEAVFPTAEMENTQANRVVDIIDLTVTQDIPTDSSIELFYEAESFEYYLPSNRSQYVMAIMYDGRQLPLTDALENGYITPAEFDNFDFEYIRKVKHDLDQVYEYPFDGYYAQAVYTDKLSNSGDFSWVNLINEVEQMETYTKEIKENDIFVTDRGTPKIPSYDEWVTKYTEEWFENNSLIIVVLEADSDVMPDIGKIIDQDKQIDLFLAEETLGVEKDQVYTVFVEMYKIDAEILNVLG